MKRIFRLIMLALGFSLTMTLIALTSLTSRVYAYDCTGGHWYSCETDSGQSAGSSPGDRSGCTVTFLGSSSATGTGQYYYNCPGTERDVTCSYYYGECCG